MASMAAERHNGGMAIMAKAASATGDVAYVDKPSGSIGSHHQWHGGENNNQKQRKQHHGSKTTAKINGMAKA